MTQRFGVLYKYFGKTYTHYGVDWACPKGTPILACADGIVKSVKNIYSPFSYGKEIRISHFGFMSQYAHLSKIVVSVGQKVVAGEVIGYSGRTGYCRGKTGYHLHFGIQKKYKWVDPLPLISQNKDFKMIIPEPSKKLIPLFRLFNPKIGSHFYTTDEKEVKDVVFKYGFVYENVIGYVYKPEKIK